VLFFTSFSYMDRFLSLRASKKCQGERVLALDEANKRPLSRRRVDSSSVGGASTYPEEGTEDSVSEHKSV
jgi:hypothetical protein